MIGRPFYPRYYPYFYHYRPAPVIVVAPRYYREPRVIIVRPHRYHRSRYYRSW